ncbi:50S ribosomal protein L9 [Carboxydothermus hydrogenoformans]|uniref:Large ribosomal subunit protein bL9 n=1 Tax=Carboxydothermus hydrogenoformans (strain ATCC BAA-161 / DSM 6008 / Z-2901) TaxID=246194 RepID=RL9_CARHZ|nr:50S ribosomal protein L9 [Carboxydothermus hydrogenoformans]Q3AG23.1 RecName: Full=Large ribosomal subunit protein bL9; AltName: Full=50S ribosomal protein L9 [Carboxydothermus hydrogenoformans Z-2901]ABB14355.1 ribosomal protein L9 [Carboxydothermus hydrogenoformans Z-2901]
MKVILLTEVKKLGKKGDVVEVAEGYGRNYLIAKGLAVEATEGKLKELQQQKEAANRRKEKELQEARSLAEKLKNIELVLYGKGGENGKLFGAITSKDIAEALEKNYQIKIDKRKLDLKENIKALGVYTVEVKLHPEVTAKLKVAVKEEGRG